MVVKRYGKSSLCSLFAFVTTPVDARYDSAARVPLSGLQIRRASRDGRSVRRVRDHVGPVRHAPGRDRLHRPIGIGGPAAGAGPVGPMWPV